MSLPSFDELLKLAQTNPEQLEELRQRMVEETINSAPDGIKRRLRGLQFQIDAERQIASNPMASCIRISKMMHDRLFELREFIEPGEQNMMSTPAASTGADVIPFRQPALAT